MSSTGDDVGGFHQSWPRAILAQDWWHFFSMSTNCASGECVVITPIGGEGPDSSLVLIPGGVWWPHVLLVIYFLGVISGYLATRLWDWLRSLRFPALAFLAPSRVVTGWVRLVSKAVTFVRKRRLISFAFGNYRSYSLRNTEGSAPTTLRRRRLQAESPRRTVGLSSPSVGLSPLREGPVTPFRVRDGSIRDGA